MTARIPPLPADEWSPDQRALVEATGELNIFTTFVRHPKLFAAFQRYAGRLLMRSTLPDTTRETLILRTAFRCRAEYEWSHHVDIAHQVGMPDEAIAAITAAEPDDPLLRAADQLVRDHNLDDDTWRALGERYDEQQLIEICLLVGNYAMIAGALNSLRVPLEPGQARPDWA